MSWNPSPKVADCREIARKWDVEQVIILAVSLKRGTMEYSSFGQTKELCAEARKYGDAAYEAIREEMLIP